MTESLFLVFSNPVEGQEARYHEWYDKHVEDLSRIPGFASARRFEIDGRRSESPGGNWRFLTLYELEGDVGQALSNLREAANSGLVERPDKTCVAEDIYSQIFSSIRERIVDGRAQP